MVDYEVIGRSESILHDTKVQGCYGRMISDSSYLWPKQSTGIAEVLLCL
jgi:hypothetical protein